MTVATRSRRPTWGEAFPKTDQVGSRAPPTEGFWNSSYPGRDACTVLIQKRYLTEETDMVPARVLARIATWRRLTEAERVSRLRECIVDEVVGNMRMEGQPVSAAWGADEGRDDPSVAGRRPPQPDPRGAAAAVRQTDLSSRSSPSSRSRSLTEISGSLTVCFLARSRAISGRRILRGETSVRRLRHRILPIRTLRGRWIRGH